VQLAGTGKVHRSFAALRMTNLNGVNAAARLKTRPDTKICAGGEPSPTRICSAQVSAQKRGATPLTSLRAGSGAPGPQMDDHASGSVETVFVAPSDGKNFRASSSFRCFGSMKASG